MEVLSIVKMENGENFYLQNGGGTANILMFGQKEIRDMPYRAGDMLVLIIARLTGCRVERAYRVFRFAITSCAISSGRKSRGTSDKSPR